MPLCDCVREIDACIPALTDLNSKRFLTNVLCHTVNTDGDYGLHRSPRLEVLAVKLRLISKMTLSISILLLLTMTLFAWINVETLRGLLTEEAVSLADKLSRPSSRPPTTRCWRTTGKGSMK